MSGATVVAEWGVPTVVVASDAFKGSLTSLEVGDAVRLGLLDVAPGARVVVVAVADGGEGTVAAALAAGWTGVPVTVHGPTGQPVAATVALSGPGGGPARALVSGTGRSPARALVSGTGTGPAHALVSGTGRSPARALDSAAPRRSTVESRQQVLPGQRGTPDSSKSMVERGTPDSTEAMVERGTPDSTRALVELADACGLGRLPDGAPAPLTASSRGLGEAMLAALDLGADELVVGIGGSASTDGGAGMLAALGARVTGADGADLPDGGAALARAARLDLSGLDRRLAGIRLVLAADVDSPLLGPTGAASVFAPQKGATPDDVAVLEAALTNWAEVVTAALPLPARGATSTNWSKLPQPEEDPTGATSTNWSKLSQQAGAGAAGGVGFALLSVLGAERRSGVEVVLGLVGLDDVLAGADRGTEDETPRTPPVLVVTGEGSLDEQTLAGKAVAGVTRRARAHGIPAVAVCGRRTLDDDGLATLGLRAAYPLSDLEPDPQRSIAEAAELLRHTGRRIAQDWLSAAPG